MAAVAALTALTGVGPALASEPGLVALLAVAARPAMAVLVLLAATRLSSPLVSVALAAAAVLFTAPVAQAQLGALLASPTAPGLLLAQEVVRGLALGLSAAAPFWAAVAAGRWAGRALDDSAAGGAPLRSLYAILAGVAFIAVDGPALLCAALAHSYQAAPLGLLLPSSWLGLSAALAAAAGWAEQAVRLALPVLLAAAVAQLSVAAAVRAAAAVAVAVPSAVLAPSAVLLLVAAMGPLLCAALAAAWQRGLAP